MFHASDRAYLLFNTAYPAHEHQLDIGLKQNAGSWWRIYMFGPEAEYTARPKAECADEVAAASGTARGASLLPADPLRTKRTGPCVPDPALRHVEEEPDIQAFREPFDG